VVTARNVVRAALYLVVTLSAVAGVYLLLAAEFVAWVQILIYVGAIVILFLFGLMLTKAPIGREALDNQRRGVALLVALAILAGLVYLIQGAFDWDAPRIDPIEGSVASVGTSLFSRFVLPFEVISLLLLAALIGAIVLSRKEDRP
jgi:NADH-quinone oxidoreductase subunit J